MWNTLKQLFSFLSPNRPYVEFVCLIVIAVSLMQIAMTPHPTEQADRLVGMFNVEYLAVGGFAFVAVVAAVVIGVRLLAADAWLNRMGRALDVTAPAEPGHPGCEPLVDLLNAYRAEHELVKKARTFLSSIVPGQLHALADHTLVKGDVTEQHVQAVQDIINANDHAETLRQVEAAWSPRPATR